MSHPGKIASSLATASSPREAHTLSTSPCRPPFLRRRHFLIVFDFCAIYGIFLAERTERIAYEPRHPVPHHYPDPSLRDRAVRALQRSDSVSEERSD
jgi:hypothetical protein